MNTEHEATIRDLQKSLEEAIEQRNRWIDIAVHAHDMSPDYLCCYHAPTLNACQMCNDLKRESESRHE